MTSRRISSLPAGINADCFRTKVSGWLWTKDAANNNAVHRMFMGAGPEKTVKYPEDSGCDQEIEWEYGKYSIVLKTTRKKGSDEILETNELSSELNYRVVKRKEISENGVLKEKTDYSWFPYQPADNGEFCGSL